ncbi:hypothetical protein Pcar_2298 [Syntrophotalea carbinolica DSM 2380]|uniref:Solute-binding protein family 3/N-terminal domain-containing protein n=2 Tax=Syntrophotalea carbinolica TaxID=19 RepID=Q3A270_SYNC1|nr:hypothetical protein Pcar_2298 [Syntrophotalea carbinolica DSM 2380]
MNAANKRLLAWIRIMLCVWLLLPTVSLASTVEIKLPITSRNNQRDDFQIGMLKLLLEKAAVDYNITLAPEVYSQARIIHELKTGSGRINLYWMGTSDELEKDLRPIRFPVYRGLLGYRIFIINKRDQIRFDAVKSLEDLQNFIGIQGIGWTDIALLEHAGLRQLTSRYANIFKMIDAGDRVDYFSRGISEGYVEVKSRQNNYPDLAVEKKLLLVYPFAMFFFTNRENTVLAEILEKGFHKAYRDGSFHQFFYNHPHIKEMFEQTDVPNRIRIDIPNPFLPPKTMAIPKPYWHGS